MSELKEFLLVSEEAIFLAHDIKDAMKKLGKFLLSIGNSTEDKGYESIIKSGKLYLVYTGNTYKDNINE